VGLVNNAEAFRSLPVVARALDGGAVVIFDSSGAVGIALLQHGTLAAILPFMGNQPA
jgi:hypothetical protein